MFPAGVLKTTLFGGFEKKSTLDFLTALLNHIQELERSQGISPVTEPRFERLKSVSFGKGYDKESVLAYIDELQTRLAFLEHQS